MSIAAAWSARPILGPCAICADANGRHTYQHGRNIVLCSDCHETADEAEVQFFGERASRRADLAHDATCAPCKIMLPR